MQIETSTDFCHQIVLTAPDGEPFVLTARDRVTRVLVDRLTVTLVTKSDGTLRPIRTQYEGRGRQVLSNGEPSRAPRKVNGSNLNWLPDALVEAIIATSEDLGVKGLAADVAKFKVPSLDAD